MNVARAWRLLILYVLVTTAAALTPYAETTDRLDSPTPAAAVITWLVWGFVLWRGFRGSLRSLDALMVLSAVIAGIALSGFVVLSPHDFLLLVASLCLAAGCLLLRLISEEVSQRRAGDGLAAVDDRNGDKRPVGDRREGSRRALASPRAEHSL